ncbi:homeodomain-interacting protein kinase 1-like [Embiotoca jacksoni]|uniref:homeodomain-interacting protein kinase 1-like n=1 Tax=Embiotoca jacksoni TaxID=100190 RepID=UPI003703E57A
MSFSTVNNRNLQQSASFSQTGLVNSEFRSWEPLHGRIADYQFWRFILNGCFNKVAQYGITETRDSVAIKILKRPGDSQKPNRELAILKKIRGIDPVNIVRFFEGFEQKGYTYLVFEMLDNNLHEMLRERHGEPLTLHEIKPIAEQLLSALNSLKTAGIVHTNITPHNILLVKQRGRPFRVKLIDFGSAITAAEVKPGSIVQAVEYRSPDVILGLPLSEAVDMWSLGCVLATLYLGSPLFPQQCQYYLVKTMVATLGQPEHELLSEGTNTQLYFKPNPWRLKTPEEYWTDTGIQPIIQRRQSPRVNSLHDLMRLYSPVDTHDDKIKLVSLLRRMLHPNPQRRITPRVALTHFFLTNNKEDDSDDIISHVMVPLASVRPMVEPAGDGRTSTKERSACSGAKNTPAGCNNEASDGAALSADAAAAAAPDDVTSVTTGRTDAVSAAAEAPDSTAEHLNKSATAESQDAALTSASTKPGTTDLHEAVSADQGTATASSDAHLTTESHDAVPADDDEVSTVNEASGDAKDEATGSKSSRSRPLKRISRLFGRMFRALYCCSSKEEDD